MKQVFVLAHDTARRNAMRCVEQAPAGYCVEVKPKTRTLEQNARMWAMLTDISRQVQWHGLTLAPVEWKDLFTALLRGQKVVPGLEGGFVVLGMRTSEMTRIEMSDLMEAMAAFGAERDVVFNDDNEVV